MHLEIMKVVLIIRFSHKKKKRNPNYPFCANNDLYAILSLLCLTILCRNNLKLEIRFSSYTRPKVHIKKRN